MAVTVSAKKTIILCWLCSGFSPVLYQQTLVRFGGCFETNYAQLNIAGIKLSDSGNLWMFEMIVRLARHHKCTVLLTWDLHFNMYNENKVVSPKYASIIFYNML